MNEGAPLAEHEPTNKVVAQCSEVVNRCRALIDVLPEAETLEYRERVADTPELKAMAKLELVKDALLSEAEAHAQQCEPYAERAARMLVQLKDAEMTIFGIYCDARQDSLELAGLVEEMFPWVSQYAVAANDDHDAAGNFEIAEAA
jgi:hypothetical protein